MNSDTQETPPPLALRIAEGASAQHVAEAVVAMWLEIDAALRPILGQRGVTMLYKRSIHLAAAAHPWLPACVDALPAELDLAPLKCAITQQEGAAAVAASHALLQTFHDLLASLIGSSLTERLLHSVWANSSSGAPAEDTIP